MRLSRCALSESLTHSMWEHNKWLFYITRFWSNLLSSQSNWSRKGGYYLHLKLWNRAHCYKGDFANIWLTHSLLILLVLLSALWDTQELLGSSSKPWLPAWVGKVSSWAVCSSAERGPWASWLLLQVNETSGKLEKSTLPETLEEATLLQRGFFIKSLFAR